MPHHGFHARRFLQVGIFCVLSPFEKIPLDWAAGTTYIARSF
jgi:hypothetical protein